MTVLAIILFFGCGTRKGDSAVAADDSSGTPPPTCHGGEALTLDSTYEDTGQTFTWAVDPAFTDDGGVFVPEDTSTLIVTCPPCSDVSSPSTLYAFEVNVQDGKIIGQGSNIWRYGDIDRVCP